MADKVLVTVVLPCLNEEDSVGQCITEAFSSLATAGYPAEVLVVDNNSTDRSAEVARSHRAQVIRERRPGYGNAVRAGIQAPRGEIVVMADADLTYDLTKIPQLVRPVAEGRADIVVGERLSQAPHSTMSFLHRRIGTPTLTRSRPSHDQRSHDYRQPIGLPRIQQRRRPVPRFDSPRHGVRVGDANPSESRWITDYRDQHRLQRTDWRIQAQYILRWLASLSTDLISCSSSHARCPWRIAHYSWFGTPSLQPRTSHWFFSWFSSVATELHIRHIPGHRC